MKNIKYFLFNFAFMLILISCDDSAHISVTNNVNNVKLDKISFGEISLGYQILLPGETTRKIKIDGQWDNVSFPMEEHLEFYMLSADNRVLLRTKEKFKLGADDHLIIIIDNDTEVVNPMKETKSISDLTISK